MNKREQVHHGIGAPVQAPPVAAPPHGRMESHESDPARRITSHIKEEA